MNKLTNAFNFRHACKIFDDSKKISEQNLAFIVDAGIKSPSSFGMEPWHFVVVSDDKIKEQLSPLCYRQKQITSCSHLVILLHRKSMCFQFESPYLRNTLKRNYAGKLENFNLDVACERFISHSIKDKQRGVSIDNWAEFQCYIAAANMMTAAAYNEIDSCAIGGIDNEKLIEFISTKSAKINKEEFGASLVLTFGYRKNEQTQQLRWSKDQLVTHL